MSKKTQSNDILYIVIIALLVIIGILAFFVWKNMGWGNSSTNVAVNNSLHEDFSILIVDDERCSDCQTDQFVTQLGQTPSLAGVEIKKVDFSDDGIEQMIKDENITALPAVIFSHNQGLDAGMSQYLTALPSGKYSLSIEAKFNPFAKRSDRGLLMLEASDLEAVKAGAYIDGNSDAKISWIEYSDLECPFCAKLHTSGTPDEVKQKYGDDINIVFQHFPLGFHANAKPGAEIAECLADQKGSEAFYALIEESFAKGNSSKSFLLDEAVKLGWDKDALEACLSAGTHGDKVDTQMARGTQLFGVTGTPGNVLINNETGEYEVLSGAYPTASFEQIIDRLK